MKNRALIRGPRQAQPGRFCMPLPPATLPHSFGCGNDLRITETADIPLPRCSHQRAQKGRNSSISPPVDSITAAAVRVRESKR